MDEAGAVHRLDRGAHRDRAVLALDAAREADKAVAVGRDGADVDLLAGAGQQAVVEPLATEIQSSVQHEDGPPCARASVWTLRSVSPRRPSFMALKAHREGCVSS